MRSLFIHDPNDLNAIIPGGVQLCSQEFLEIVKAASDEVRLLPVTVTRAPSWRLRRRLGLGSYLFYKPEECRAALTRTAAGFKPTHVFLNRSELIRLAPLVREVHPDAKIVVMSHGNQSGDDLYEISGPGGRRGAGPGRLSAIWQLGLDLVTESYFRHRNLDAVCVMSAEEEMLERWLGAKKTVVLPRIIRPCPLEWSPVPGRVGFVGTLNHTPNRIALDQLCDRLAKNTPTGFELRLVGGPEAAGRALAEKYSFVTYIGRLDDAALGKEVSGWSLFLNPIFWLSRGASMKLGQSLSWAIPALTTRAGARGYRLAPDHVFMTADSAEAFAQALTRLLHTGEQPALLRQRLLDVSGRWPDSSALGRQLKADLS